MPEEQPVKAKPGSAKPIGRLLAEMVLIVASILLAFALDSWWDERKDRVDEQAILGALHDEFSAARVVLEKYEAYGINSLTSLRQFHKSAQAGRWLPENDTPDYAVASMMIAPTSDVSTGVLDALIGSGRIELLQNSGLLIRLARWDGVLRELQDDELVARKFLYETVVPYLVSQGIPFNAPFESFGLDLAVEPPGASLLNEPGMVERLLIDPVFRSMLEFRIGFLQHQAEEYEATMAELDAILDEISGSMTGTGS